MSEFSLDRGDSVSSARFLALDSFTQAYVEAMFFTDASDPDDGDLADATFADLAPATLEQIVADCAEFQAQMAATLEAAGRDDSNAGHDFWMTRNGHGCGFWDGDWPEPYATYLTNACKRFGQVDIYRGDDGRIYA